MPPRDYGFFIYIAASRSRQLYLGMTNSLRRRMAEHRHGTYTGRYRIDRLVYYEQTQYVDNAINREKELKDWNRAKKIALVKSVNPTWEDLSQSWEPMPIRKANPSASLRDDKDQPEPA